ncbi:MAG: MarR family transcriptional regulator [Aliidongia sp.]
MQPPNESLLFHVKTAGPIQADQLAARLGISPQAVRQQMDRLLDAGLVQYDDRTTGPGRPKRFWSLTEQGHGRFPDSHAQLTLGLIDAMRAEFGEAALDRLIARRERDLTASYEAALAGQSLLSEKIAVLTALRQAEGYMASWRETPDGFVLIEGPLPDLRSGQGLPGLLPFRAGAVPIGLGFRLHGRADRPHHRRRPALRLSDRAGPGLVESAARAALGIKAVGRANTVHQPAQIRLLDRIAQHDRLDDRVLHHLVQAGFSATASHDLALLCLANPLIGLDREKEPRGSRRRPQGKTWAISGPNAAIFGQSAVGGDDRPRRHR